MYLYTDASKLNIDLSSDLYKELSPDCDFKSLGNHLLKKAWTHKLNDIVEKNPNDARQCCERMLEYWLNSFKTVTWSTIIDALQKIDQVDQDLVKLIGNDTPIKGS